MSLRFLFSLDFFPFLSVLFLSFLSLFFFFFFFFSFCSWFPSVTWPRHLVAHSFRCHFSCKLVIHKVRVHVHSGSRIIRLRPVVIVTLLTEPHGNEYRGNHSNCNSSCHTSRNSNNLLGINE